MTVKVSNTLKNLMIGCSLSFGAIDLVQAAADDASTQAQAIDPDLTKAIESYIKTHPEVVAKALETYAIQQQSELQKLLQEHLKKYNKELVDTTHATVLGDKKVIDNAMIIFYDVNCPHCRRLGTIVKSLRAKNPSLPIIMRPWSILGKDSESVAEVLLAAEKSGHFEKLLYALFESEERLSLGKVYEIANKMGIKEDVLIKTVKENSEKIQKILDFNKKLAQNLSLSGTPVIILNKNNKLGIVDLRSGISADGLNKYFTDKK